MDQKIWKKRQIVRKLLNNDDVSDDELLDMLIDEPIAIDTDKEMEDAKTFGEAVADKLTLIVGSWKFIIFFVGFLVCWMVGNIIFSESIDPYPFILLNLLLSCFAALQAPIIMMSQNREAKKDTLRSKNDYKTDLKSELILEVLHEEIQEILKNEKEIMANLCKFSETGSKK